MGRLPSSGRKETVGLGTRAVGSARRLLVLVAAIVMASMLGAVAGALAALVRGAPSLDELRFDPRQTTYLYDRKGRVITRLALEHRVPVSIDEIPKAMQQAIIAVEDSDFEYHHGIDLRAMLRALWVDLRTWSRVQGGGTITMQLARNAFLSQEKTITRKIKEMIWAVQLERRYTKEEILEAYLNEIYLGQGAYGVEAAAETYFGKSIREVTLAEAALLAGLARSPEGLYDPFRHPDRALARRNFVLDRMVEVGYISPRAAEEAKKQPLGVKRLQRDQGIARYFVDYVVQDLLDRYGKEMVWGGGLRVYTTLDLDLQREAEETIRTGLPVFSRDADGISQPEAAIVTLDPQTGDILAMVGGRGEDKYNRAVLATRQPGSAIKPFIWLAALDRGYATPATVIEDKPLSFPDPNGGPPWEPKNYNNQFIGPVTLRTALENSINTVAVQLLQQVGPATVMSYMEKMGITTLVRGPGSPNDLNLSLALGGLTRGVTPLEMAAAYGVLAAGGVYSKPRAILRVDDASGYTLEENPPRQKVVLSEVSTYLLTDMMRGVVERGTGRQARLPDGRPVAGKTGTTQDYTNAWFVGFTPDLVTSVWIGNDVQSKPIVGPKGQQIGSATAARLWGQYMRQAVAGFPVRDFPRPAGIVDHVRIDTKTGLLAPPDCGLPPSQVRDEIFAKGTEPTEESPNCRQPWWQIPDWLRQPIEGLFDGGR
ncbi:PBP1A family penicillin-binding protein [Carboxydochorda subterranea]|uniref:PBP1A family penicillin-binding protein n=1 Tax=Carboxydichorda subterranea TaxID=3109565 RepID=A0ABZ1C0S2_9FIRM|nr:PBP1A family penicillin-binding protein [Limnochorda sp. L945t]WRP18700.1 PBP1A family penicillin-binding protein [Limnochorda sp. L945t]